MLRLVYGAALLLSLGVLGCGESSEPGGTAGAGGDTGGAGGTMIFEPGPTCTAFCAQAVGECEVSELGSDAACTQNCELERSFAEETSEACLDAFEESIDCAAALDCQDIIDRVNGVNVDAYPCRSEVEDTARICTQG